LRRAPDEPVLTHDTSCKYPAGIAGRHTLSYVERSAKHQLPPDLHGIAVLVCGFHDKRPPGSGDLPPLISARRTVRQDEIFTFIEEPQLRGNLTKLWARKAEDPSVCRDEKGALPQIVHPAVTPRGVKIGDSADEVIRRYGEPTRVVQPVDNTDLLVYEMPPPADGRVENVILSFKVDKGHVLGFMLEGDRPEPAITGPCIQLDITALKGTISLVQGSVRWKK